jgi:hypothetical protein
VLSEYFGKVTAADIHRYGYGSVHDFLATPHETNAFDWVITNPPFRLEEDFTLLALKLARRGVYTIWERGRAFSFPVNGSKLGAVGSSSRRSPRCA